VTAIQIGDRVKVPGGVTAVVWEIDGDRIRIGMGKTPSERREFGWYSEFKFVPIKSDPLCKWKILKKDW
jgi:hypothetical protein